MIIIIPHPGDLRERHRRRCEKFLDTVRSHRRKSCNLYARSKVKCDLQTPTCQRYMDRHTQCEYLADSSLVATSHWHENLVVPVATASALIILLSDDPVSTDLTLTNGQLKSATSHMEPMLDDGMNMDWGIGLNDKNSLEFGNTRSWILTPAETEALAASAVPKVVECYQK